MQPFGAQSSQICENKGRALHVQTDKNYIQEVAEAEAIAKSEKNFEGFIEDAGAIANFGKNYDPTTENVEAMLKF